MLNVFKTDNTAEEKCLKSNTERGGRGGKQSMVRDWSISIGGGGLEH